MTKTTIILLQNDDFTMPKSCSDCLFCSAIVLSLIDTYDCRLLNKCVDQYRAKGSKPDCCPIKSVETVECDRIENGMFVD